MRLGGPIPGDEQETPAQWIEALRKRGYRAAFCPLSPGAAPQEIAAFREAAAAADIVIAEVGAWSNPLSADAAERETAVQKCTSSLALAEAIGARCCVNIVGSLGARWDGPDPRNVSAEAVQAIAASVRGIVDAVAPTRTTWAIEMMPWTLPDSPDSYLELLSAIDRPAVAVHLDPVNIINSPRRYYDNAEIIRECFAKLGPRIVSCHAKDIVLREQLTVHLDECRPGTGGLDYTTYLRELERLDADTPLMLEHLSDQGEYARAADYVRSVAADAGIAT